MPETCSSVQRTLSKIHLIFNAWSSPSRASVLGVIGRYINEQYKLSTHLLSLTEMPESHTEANLAERIFATTEKFKTSERISFVISDNASNMNSCIKAMETSFQAAGIDWTERYHRIRCLAHIIHLAATAFFFPSNDAPENPNDFEAWRQFACFNKLHNIVKWIKTNPKRNNKWKQFSDLMLLQDNKTRWNSWYDICEQAVMPDIRGALIVMMDSKSELQLDYLSPADFDNLVSLTRFLKPFKDWTIQTEKARNSLDMVLPAYDALLSHLEKARVIWNQNEFITARVEASWFKLNKYYNHTDDTSAYFAATVLNPTLKMAYFEQKWGLYPSLTRHIEQLKDRMIKKWRNEYRPAFSTISQVVVRNVQTVNGSTSIFANIHGSLRRTTLAEDELELYLREPILTKDDIPNIHQFQVLDWWCKQRQRSRYPHLHRYALDFLSVPAQSSEIERVFSECKASLTQQRNRMEIATLEQVQQMRSWLRCARNTDEQLIDALPSLAPDEATARVTLAEQWWRHCNKNLWIAS